MTNEELQKILIDVWHREISADEAWELIDNNREMKQEYQKAIALAWQEMNNIRARDGVPCQYDGTRSSVTQEYWDSVMDGLDKILRDETGKGAWLHPSLYA